MDVDLIELKASISRHSDDELIAITSINSSYYRQEMIDYAKLELEKRGLTPLEDRVVFDVLVNSDGYAGRLILIGEELLFLSTGMSEIHTNSGGLGGMLAQETNFATRTTAAKRLNFTAINNQGSWAYFLNQISHSAMNSSWMSGSTISVSGTDKNGDFTAHIVSNAVLSTDDFNGVGRQIQNTISKFK